MVFMMDSRVSSRGGSPLRPPVTPFGIDSTVHPIENGLHPVFHAGRVAVITGAASGIGRAAAEELARIGLRVALADINAERLKEVGADCAKLVGEQNVLVVPTDVSKLEDVKRLRDKVLELWGEVAVLLNNAGIGGIKGMSWNQDEVELDNWKKIFDVNMFGILNVQHTFVPAMLHQENPSVIINTGSKQGITNPPGNAAYNASKAAVKSLTESLAFELRQDPSAQLTAHLFIPGWTYTSIGSSGLQPTDPNKKPSGAWSATETVLYMLDKVRSGQFYILCPDGETRPEIDKLRILWAAGDLTEGRPALSRWHPEYKCLFEEYMKEGLADI